MTKAELPPEVIISSSALKTGGTGNGARMKPCRENFIDPCIVIRVATFHVPSRSKDALQASDSTERKGQKVR